jgi:hypothetical protein
MPCHGHVPPFCGSSPFDRLLYNIWATGVKLGPTGLYIGLPLLSKGDTNMYLSTTYTVEEFSRKCFSIHI